MFDVSPFPDLVSYMRLSLDLSNRFGYWGLSGAQWAVAFIGLYLITELLHLFTKMVAAVTGGNLSIGGSGIGGRGFGSESEYESYLDFMGGEDTVKTSPDHLPGNSRGVNDYDRSL